MLLAPVLLYFCVWGGTVTKPMATTTLTILIGLTVSKLDHTPRPAFMYARFWKIWIEYFDMTYDVTSVGTMKKDEKYFFFEVLSCPVVVLVAEPISLVHMCVCAMCQAVPRYPCQYTPVALSVHVSHSRLYMCPHRLHHFHT